jgi:hypothetical protein
VKSKIKKISPWAKREYLEVSIYSALGIKDYLLAAIEGVCGSG